LFITINKELKVKVWKIVLIRCAQPMLYGAETKSLYSPNRTLTPEPTLAQLQGIIQDFSKSTDIPFEVVQLDLRDPVNGTVSEVQYGILALTYLDEPLRKVYSGIFIDDVTNILDSADVIGFTNNFAMSRKVVADHIAKARALWPDTEIWIGGRDVFTKRVEQVYTNAADNRNTVVFRGHVYDSLPAYLSWRIRGVGEPFGVSVFDDQGRETRVEERSLLPEVISGVRNFPLPRYICPESLDHFIGSGEGQPSSPFGRFVHMSITIGCPHACGYCTTGCRERYLVWKDMVTLESELEMYKRMGVQTIAIMDDNLLDLINHLGVEGFVRIMERVNSYGFRLEYGNGLQLSLLSKYWDQIKEPVFDRCESLYAPLEDLTRDRLYDKLDDTLTQLGLMQLIASEAPDRLKYVTMGVIVGVPLHTKEALQTTFLENVARFLSVFRNSRLEVGMTVFNFMPLPGTKFGEQALDSGRMVVADPIAEDPEVCSFGTTSYAPPGMTHKEVFRAYISALNLNPAGKKLGVDYVTLQRLGARALPEGERHRIPEHWKTPGYHLRARVE